MTDSPYVVALEARIRDLEAELAVYREPVPGLEKTWRSRAEKAELERDESRREEDFKAREINRLLELVKKAEAALAIAEDILRRFIRTGGPHEARAEARIFIDRGKPFQLAAGRESIANVPIMCDGCGKRLDSLDEGLVVPGLGGKPLGLACRVCAAAAKPAALPFHARTDMRKRRGAPPTGSSPIPQYARVLEDEEDERAARLRAEAKDAYAELNTEIKPRRRHAPESKEAC